MVEVFRKPEDLYAIAEEAIEINAKVLWGQILSQILFYLNRLNQ